MATFGSVWRGAAAMCPGVPPLIVRGFAQDAWKAAADSRQWGWRRRQAGFRLEAARDLQAVGVIAGSVNVTSAALFLVADLGRQFRVGSYPVYTIVTVTSTSAIVLDRPFLGNTNAAAAAEILDAYVTVPDNFGQFLLVVDPTQQCRIGHWYTQEQLAQLDPVRTNASDGSPRGVFAGDYAPEPLVTAGLVRYEVWPYVMSGSQLAYWYTLAVVDLNDEEEMPGVFRHRGDVLELGTRAGCAQFPGTPAMKNPGYDLNLATQLDTEWRALLRQMEIRDDDQYGQDLVQYMTWPLATLAPTADYLRRTDWPAGAYAWGDGTYW